MPLPPEAYARQLEGLLDNTSFRAGRGPTPKTENKKARAQREYARTIHHSLLNTKGHSIATRMRLAISNGGSARELRRQAREEYRLRDEGMDEVIRYLLQRLREALGEAGYPGPYAYLVSRAGRRLALPAKKREQIRKMTETRWKGRRKEPPEK